MKRATGKYTAVTSGDDHDVVAKCLLIGAAGAGKSSLLRAIGREDSRYPLGTFSFFDGLES